MMLPKDLTHDVKTRLRTVRGQLDALVAALDSERDPEALLLQFKAAQHGLDRAYILLLDEVFRKALAITIVETANACPGNCGNEEKIEFIRRQFPHLKTDALTTTMKEIAELKERLNAGRTEPTARAGNAMHPDIKQSILIEPMKHTVEIFTAGCPVCDPTVAMVKELARDANEVIVYNATAKGAEHVALAKATEYGVERLPSVIVDGRLLDCCRVNALSREELIRAGIGQT